MKRECTKTANKKMKVIYALLIGAMLSIGVTGCGMISKIANLDMKTQKTDWFEENGYTIYETGEYEFKTYVEYIDGENNRTPVPVTLNYTINVTETDNGDGTKTVTGVFTHSPYVFEDGAWSTGRDFCFVADRYTGTVFINEEFERNEFFSVTYEDYTAVNLSIYLEQNKATNKDMNKIQTVKVVVPSDYDGLVFGHMGNKTELSEDFWGATYNVLELIVQDENCEVKFFAD